MGSVEICIGAADAAGRRRHLGRLRGAHEGKISAFLLHPPIAVWWSAWHLLRGRMLVIWRVTYAHAFITHA